ncbi:MAG: hypothetical protein JO166_22110 [Deltaproteobacteria bacterium]|nr:hypothetical protein [Deltaproteobacteria bacterium]
MDGQWIKLAWISIDDAIDLPNRQQPNLAKYGVLNLDAIAGTYLPLGAL